MLEPQIMPLFGAHLAPDESVEHHAVGANLGVPRSIIKSLLRTVPGIVDCSKDMDAMYSGRWVLGALLTTLLLQL